ncbi:hypothetical protein Val02_18230 [Virgisporangium aliadipatigenens]|uniref:Uncharacterized protein n=1 Tax=Virgisporangium aliadipatigenens TaxID=741659 RepID=A0A8J4DQ06_9ACTN|nr:hypothetical protein Val02_18230 [Virgisporangium aliadipatigenens]
MRRVFPTVVFMVALGETVSVSRVFWLLLVVAGVVGLRLFPGNPRLRLRS